MPSASCDGVLSRSVSPVGVASAARRANSRSVTAWIYRLRATTLNKAGRLVAAHGAPGRRLWQRNFYERVVRSEEDMDRIRVYIRDNPLGWELDDENPL